MMPERGAMAMAEFDTEGDEIALAADKAAWLVAMDREGEDAGYFQRAGRSHWAYFADEKATLLVGFETVDAAHKRPGRRPLVQMVARPQRWSHLTLLAQVDTWWRDPGLYAFFDRLVDDAFFEDFDRVLFYGAGPAGHAAAAYSVCAPGAEVLLLAPRATMDPGIAGWDRRDLKARGLDFRSRYGYAPDMIEGAGRVTVLFDPTESLDAMHAALFRGPHVERIPLPHAGAGVEATLLRLGILEELMVEAAGPGLTRAAVTRAWRKRRGDQTWLKALLAQAGQTGSTRREAAICRWVIDRMRAPRFARRLAELEPPKP